MIIGIDASRATTGQRTGTEAYAYYLIRALIPLAAERRYRLRLYFNQSPPGNLFDDLDAGGFEYVIIPQRRLWTHLRLGRELRARPPVVFFTPAHVIPIGYNGPSVATIHDLGYEYFPEAHPPRQLAYLRWSTRHNARVARRIVADSAATRSDLIKFYNIDPVKIDVIYPGADPGVRRSDNIGQIDAALAKYGLRRPYFLYLGTLQPRKNLVRLVEAFAASRLHQEGYTLVLAGKQGWLADPLQAAVGDLPSSVRPHVHLPGYIGETEKNLLLSGATALVFPSLYEGFGFPVLEAQACGTPVICANTSSLPEVVGDGALLIDPLDVQAIAGAMRQITGDAALRARLVEFGYANLGRFTWSKSAGRVLSVLEAAAR